MYNCIVFHANQVKRAFQDITTYINLTLALSMVNIQHHICSAPDKQCAPIKKHGHRREFFMACCCKYIQK